MFPETSVTWKLTRAGQFNSKGTHLCHCWLRPQFVTGFWHEPPYHKSLGTELLEHACNMVASFSRKINLIKKSKVKLAMFSMSQLWKSLTITCAVFCWPQRIALMQCGKEKYKCVKTRRQESLVVISESGYHPYRNFTIVYVKIIHSIGIYLQPLLHKNSSLPFFQITR
jgi:hypothetical protein